MKLVKHFKKFLLARRVNYQPLIEIRIYKDRLLGNLTKLQKQFPALQIAPVLKSNAYGHGLALVASIFDGQKLPFLVVDSFFEALTLKREGIKIKILVLGFATADQINQADLNDCSFGITSLEQLEQISNKLDSKKNFHLKIDTGMHRQGILIEEIDKAKGFITNNPLINLEGLCTHFADASNQDESFTNKQIELWNKVVADFRKEFPNIKYFHASNTAGLKYSPKVDANVARVGIGLYQNTLEMRSSLSLVKQLYKGEKIGYDLAFEAPNAMKIATVPVGYFEGVDRRLSNKGSFKIKGIFCLIVGHVSMNMTTIDVSSVSEVKLGEDVVVISANALDPNSVVNLAKLCDCTEYEILVHIPQSLRRIIV